MKPIHTPPFVLATLALVAPLLAQDPEPVSAQKPTEVPAPLDSKGEFESVQDYLLARYDLDRDGRITALEYTRNEESFKRLDKNQDGVLTAEDFARGARGNRRGTFERVGRIGRSEMNTQKAMRFVAWYFQGDDEPHELSLAELEAALAAYDTDEDGVLSTDELECGIPLRSKLGQEPSGPVARTMKDEDAYESLLAAVDKDKNRRLARVELVAFFKAEDGNADGVWDESNFGASGLPGAAARGRESRPVTGPAAGTPAPDFALTTLQGDELVRLSDFRGKKPVALIFGSYT